MRRVSTVVAGVLVFLAAILLAAALAVSIHGTDLAARSNKSIQQLLLDGKTASAIAAKKTAGEVEKLLIEHSQTVKQQRALARIVLGIEQHLDVTIERAVDQAALRVAREFTPKR